jgi:hypothetical protein
MITHFNPNLLPIEFMKGVNETGLLCPKVYKLTHSEMTGELFLTIRKEINYSQINGIYTKLMRDEVLAEWDLSEPASLHVFCHVSGGLVFGTTRIRESIFRYHRPMVLEAFCYGDQIFLEENPKLAKGKVVINYLARKKDTIRMRFGEYWKIIMYQVQQRIEHCAVNLINCLVKPNIIPSIR